MKWGRYYQPDNKNRFVPGDWNSIDDRFGTKVKASKTQKQWDGFRTVAAERRHEQDFIRAVSERIRSPYSRPEVRDQFRNQGVTVENGLFTTDSDWTKGVSWSIDTDKRAASWTGSTDTLFQSVNAQSGSTYEVVFTVFNYVGAGSVTASVGATSGTARTGNGTYLENILSGGANPDRITFTPGAGGTSFDITAVRVLRVG